MAKKGYIQKIRTKLGKERFIHPAARIILQDERGRVLFIRRRDTGRWGIPAGGLEEGETIEACIRREVREETGLVIGELTLIGLSTDPVRERVRYSNGDQIQYFTAEFFSDRWSGKLIPGAEEVIELAFHPPGWKTVLPENEQSAFNSLDYFRQTGKVRLD